MNNSSSDQRKSEEISFIFALLEELKVAEVLIILFYHHKHDLNYWTQLKDDLIRLARNYRQLSFLATLVRASTKSSLSESCVLVPGLLNFLRNIDDVQNV